MPRGRGRIKFEDLRLGEGPVATRAHSARVSCTLALRLGETVCKLDDEWIDLSRRHAAAGIRYGIEGMRVGGIRRIVIPPHLGYGHAGAAPKIPPDAVLICELELVELRPASAATPPEPEMPSE